MPILTATNIRHNYGQRMILDGVSLSLEPGQRVGIVGRNGCGKSTLMKALEGVLTPDYGEVILGKGFASAYLKQDVTFEPGETLRTAAESAFEKLHDLHRDLNHVFHLMETAEGEALDRLLKKQERLEGEIDGAGGYTIDHKIEQVLHGLGFSDKQFSIPVESLSGGQRNRLALAICLLKEPDLLLLDEPTNHLDIDGRLWLERFLVDEFRGAVILISHDRYMLDNVVTRIIEVENGRLIDYPGNYEAFREIRSQRRLSMLRAFENQQTQFKKEEAYIRKYKAGQRAKQAKGRATKLERAKGSSDLERPMDVEVMRLRLPKAERTGDIVATARGISKSYPADDGSIKTLFHELDMIIGRGDRWAIIGPNGAGKSTLVRCLLKEQEVDEGVVNLGSSLKVGYYRQGHDHIDGSRKVYEYLQEVILKEAPGTQMSEQGARDLAGAFLFSGSEQEREIGVLSGGERARAVLAGLLASAKNVLVLDEPTNHLDIPSAERLEDVLQPDDEETGRPGFSGVLILISHDRALIDATCDHLMVFDGNGGVTTFNGNYTEWTEKQAEIQKQANAEESAAKARKEHADKQRKTQEQAADAQVKAQSQRAKSAAANPFAKMSSDKLEQRIATVEARIKDIDEKLLSDQVWKNPAKAATFGTERSSLAAELEGLEYEYFSRQNAGR